MNRDLEIYKLIFENAREAITLVDINTLKFAEVNPATCEKTGYTREELMSMSPLDFTTPEYNSTVPQRLATLFEHGRDAYETEIRTKTGQVIPIELSLGLMDCKGGKIIMAIIRDISDRRQAENALRLSESRLRSLTSSAKDFIYMKDPELRFVMVNPAMESMFIKKFGLTEHEVIGRKAADIYPPEQSLNMEKSDGSVLAGDVVAESHSEIIDGEEKVYINVKTPVRDEKGGIIGICGISRDITSYRRILDASRLDESRLEALVQLSRMQNATLHELADFALEQGVILTQSEIGYLAFVSEDEQILTMYAWSKSAMKECAIEYKPIVYPLESTGLWGEALRQRAPQITNDYNMPDPRKKGIPAGHCEIRRHMNIPVLDGGKVVVVAGVGNKKDPYNESDVRQLSLLMDGMWKLVQRNRAEQALRESERRLSDIIEFLPDATFAIDIEGKVIAWNRAMEEMTGVPAPDMLGKGDYEYALPLYGERKPLLVDYLFQPDESALQGYRDFVVTEKEIVAPEIFAPAVKPGGAWLWAKASLLYDSEGRIIGAIESVRDVSDIRMNAERLKELSRISISALEEERTRISRELHDELGQQLAALSLELECMAMQSELRKENIENMEEIIGNTTAELRRIYKGLRPPILDDIGLVPAMKSLVNEVVSRAADIKFETDLDADMPYSGEGSLDICFYRVLQETLNNVVRHSGAGKVRISLKRLAQECILEVEDNGKGFDTGHVGDRCFGIAGMKERAAICGGTIEVESSPGRGTKVTMRAQLPPEGEKR